MQFKVLELLVRDQIGTGFRAGQYPVPNDPLVLFPTHMPTTEILAIEQLDGPIPFWIGGMCQLGGPLTGPGNNGTVRIDQGALEGAIYKSAMDDHITALGFPLIGDREGELPLSIGDDLRDRPGTAKGEDKSAE